jgi:hypothetical protein
MKRNPEIREILTPINNFSATMTIERMRLERRESSLFTDNRFAYIGPRIPEETRDDFNIQQGHENFAVTQTLRGPREKLGNKSIVQSENLILPESSDDEEVRAYVERLLPSSDRTRSIGRVGIFTWNRKKEPEILYFPTKSAGKDLAIEGVETYLGIKDFDLELSDSLKEESQIILDKAFDFYEEMMSKALKGLID